MSGGTSSWSRLNPFASLIPSFLHRPSAADRASADTTTPLLGEALLSSVGLKALLPSVPKITPQLPTLNQTVEINGTAAACNETELNWNRTAEMSRLHCNESNPHGTNITVPTVDPLTGLPGMQFFANLHDMNNKFKREVELNKTAGGPGGANKGKGKAAATEPSKVQLPPKPPHGAKASLPGSIRGKVVAGGKQVIVVKQKPKQPHPQPQQEQLQPS
jgi:hypothetical protein